MAGIYKFYKERLIEISGRNRSLFAKKISKKNSYDIGKLLAGDYEEINNFIDFLWKGRRHSYTLVGKDSKDRIYKNFKIEDKVVKLYKDTTDLAVDKVRNENLRRERVKREEAKKAVVQQINELKHLKREVEEFAKESGRYEMFVGFPFVEGSIGRDQVVKAPLLLFPVTINIEDETTAELELKQNEPVQLNKVFALAYAKHHKLNVEDMLLEFDSLLDYKFKNVANIVDYLKTFGYKLNYSARKGLFDYERSAEPKLGDDLEIKNYAVVGRFPLANSIYNDYNMLEKNKLTTNAINELLESRNLKKIKKPNTKLYTINQLDYAQENAIAELNKNGNMVIYGPPGTGKSQTIVNIITDALSKNKRVLVVSQKKAALDVVFNRLGVLNNKAMYINDAEKNKAQFYERAKTSHQNLETAEPVTSCLDQYKQVESSLTQEINQLELISDTLFTPTPFGLSLQQMYANSYIIGKNTNEYEIYKAMQTNSEFMKLNYADLSNTLRVIKEKKKVDLFYKHIELQKNNPLTEHIQSDLDVHTINSTKSYISKMLAKRLITPLDINKHANTRQLLAFYLENDLQSRRQLNPIIKGVAKLENPNLHRLLKVSYVLWPAYPIAKLKLHNKANQISKTFTKTLEDVKSFLDEHKLLERVLDKKGYAIAINSMLNGNTLYLKLLIDGLDNYVDIREINLNLKDLTTAEEVVLNFAYENSKNLKACKQLISALLPVRIYHELVLLEDKNKEALSKIMEYSNIKNRILSLKSEQNQIVQDICLEKFRTEYLTLYNKDPENKNFLYQISKQQNLWPLRKITETYCDLLLTLFPCWLLSPENVSTIMPLQKNLFDLIIFDEASQIFIENTLPTIYRGQHIVVAGDSKQLRPTATFMRRYMGNDIDDLDLSTQAALEVESLLDLATSRYNNTNLTYHYRSKNEELISFSNHAFYDCKLQIAPNITKNMGSKPIERIKVDGRWLDRHNKEEAKKVVELVKKTLKTRKNNETIGIITFNTEQEEYIEDLLDAEAKTNPWFSNAYLKEQHRKDNGEDTSIFVKNLENVQGDERDIIIFSIGYAKNEYGKVVSRFGPLNMEGGENRLNVAITRAKQKIYLVISIEPEELVVENSKNQGPKIFKKYLQYARAVSGNNKKEAHYILESFKQQNIIAPLADLNSIEHDMKEELEKLGYTVDINLGNNSYKLSLAIYDKKLDHYLVGVELDSAAFESSASVIERDVFRSQFMESRGWKILRIWSRDWWQNKAKVISLITKAAEKTKERLSVTKELKADPKTIRTAKTTETSSSAKLKTK